MQSQKFALMLDSVRRLMRRGATARAMNVHVHASSVRACATGFKRTHAPGNRKENTNET